MANKLKVGDTIKCNSKEEMVSMSEALASENIFTDFLYENEGAKVFWLTVEAVAVESPSSVAELNRKCVMTTADILTLVILVALKISVQSVRLIIWRISYGRTNKYI